MNLADNLKRIRKENNLSQEQLAEKLGVSRQSVSKWESNQAYPEMDKMLQLCEMFNLNMDDLLNQNISEVNSKKKSKINVNKYIDSFLDFLTKTTKMFGAMSFKQKLKCIFEQIFLGICLIILFVIVGTIMGVIVRNLISFLPSKLYYPISSIFEGIYLIACLVFGVMVLLHIFKIRYLNYYVVVNDEKEEEKKETEPEKIVGSSEKIIIRDPKHSEYGFIKGLANVVLFIIKIFAIIVSFILALSLIGFAALLILSFTITGSGILFVGILIGLIAAIVVNGVLLSVLFKFIIGEEIRAKLDGIIILVCLVLAGFSVGLIVRGASNIEEMNVDTDKDSKYFVTETYEYEYDENIIIHFGREVEYHEIDGNNVKLVLTHYKDYECKFVEHDSMIDYINQYGGNDIGNIKRILNDLNDKKVVDYHDVKLDIYASKENLAKLKVSY